MQTLSLPQARALHLAAQGLLQPLARPAQEGDVAACVQRMGLLQIDTIHVVARSPYLVLHARLGDYPPAWLEDALANGALFETWAHEACFAPADDLHLHRAYNREGRTHWGISHAQKLAAAQRPQLDALLDQIRTQGPVKSSDFVRLEGKGGAWWGWKDEKRWLEALFALGELMIARRDHFHRVYDLSERVAPALRQPAPALPPDELAAAWVEKAVAALGVTQARWINDYFRTKPRLQDAHLEALVRAGRIQRVAVEGWAAAGYVHTDHTGLLQQALAGDLVASHTALLSPFDPVVWDRERASTFFDFDYKLECYTPEAQRVYGYFVLPILCRGELIGRLDAKAHRAEGVFEVKSLHAQPGGVWTEQQVQEVAAAIRRCAAWHGTPQVRIGRTQPAKLAAALRRALKRA
ncbi:crosslink repair DNA glycosylase YcaQ family protein [Rhodoferax sp. TBRC 17198]|uniref:winged helix-turn-helix domain-containing protein n=1 Tax=Rhodoferax potami TaxID=3068338 RepID=UPI0028BE0E12|nr:crosslink repair DNA glycosylase YcaQ family protein [Rhodoferax sp. TBRC 17198]MDT7520974.1 crosslink repair DNA glycosylase YcaQ family protein [Rhodoferax sp. TBRC 17198]